MSVCLFCVCVVLCAGSGLATGWSPVQGVLPTMYRIKKLKKRPRSKWLWLDVPALSDGSVENPRKALVRIAGLRAEILTPDPWIRSGSSTHCTAMVDVEARTTSLVRRGETERGPICRWGGGLQDDNAWNWWKPLLNCGRVRKSWKE
jgi:hypothetical protein